MSTTDKKSLVPIKAYIRQRPLSKNEIDSKCVNAVQSISSRDIILKSGFNERKFSFDYVFGEDASQVEVYNTVVSPMIRNVISGFNCTVFAYGNTGTGKTYTVFGEIKKTLDTSFTMDPLSGLILRASEQLFSELSKLSGKVEYTVQFSFLEIYNEEVRDLLNENLPLRIYDDPSNKGSVCIKDVRQSTVFNSRDVNEWLNIGVNDRQNAATNFNLQSSRGHTVVTFVVNIRDVNSKGDEIIKTGRLQLVDLAGSENIGRSGAVDVRAREAGTINRSLITLGKVLKALAQKIHIPFRDSKLTRILQDSLGGNAKTALIATISPSDRVWDETIATLDLAQISKSIMNSPVINISKKQANLVEELEKEIAKLKDELKAARGRDGFYVSAETYQKMTEDLKENNQKVIEMLKQLRELEEHARSQDLQHRNLTDSFMKTREYLEKMENALKEKQKSVQRVENKMSHMKEQWRELNKTADILFTVSEDSTKHEEIYHKKYQDKCITNISNVETAKKMIEIAVECLKNIENVSQYCFKHATDHIADIKAANIFFKKQCLNNFDQLSGLSTEICNLAAEIVLNMNNLVDLDLENINRENETFVGSIFENLQANHLNDLKEIITNLRRNLIIKTSEWTEITNACLKELQESIAHRIKKDELFVLQLHNIEEQISERMNSLKEQIKMEDNMIEMFANQIEKAEIREEVLIAEARSLEEILEQMGECRRSGGDEEKEKIEDLLKYFSYPIEEMHLQQSSSEVAMHKVEDMQKNLSNQASTDTDKIDQHVCKVVETVQQKLDESNTVFKGAALGWSKQIEELNDSVMNLANFTGDKLNNSIHFVKDTILEYGKVIKETIAKSMNALNQLDKNVDCVGHVGDTPVKKTHNYPKTIASVTSPIFLDESKENEDPNQEPEN